MIPIRAGGPRNDTQSGESAILKIATEYGVANGIAKYGLDGRVTYVIGGDGRILKVYPKVDPALNASENHQPVRQR
jgi:peroxiredoxin